MSFFSPELLQFGIAGLLFIVWAYTFKSQNRAFVEVSNKSSESIGEAVNEMGDAYKAAIEDSRSRNDALMNLIRENAREEQELKTHLIRTLTRLEEKLDQPVRCPAAIADRLGEPL